MFHDHFQEKRAALEERAVSLSVKVASSAHDHVFLRINSALFQFSELQQATAVDLWQVRLCFHTQSSITLMSSF